MTGSDTYNAILGNLPKREGPTFRGMSLGEIQWQAAKQKAQELSDESKKKRENDALRGQALTYDEVAELEHPGSTTSPTSKMSPNPVLPDNNPALAGVNVQQDAAGAASQEDTGVPKYDSYAKMLEFLEANQKMDADADKRAKRRELFAAIGDGISALASMYQATKGAPPVYQHGNDMSEVMRQRYDRMIAQRKADSDKYMNYLKVLAAKEAAEEQRDHRQQMAEYRQQQMAETERTHRENEEIKRRQVEIRQQVADAQVKAAEARQGKDEAQARYWDAYAAYRAQGMDDNHAKAMAQIAKTNAQAANVGAPTTTTSTRYDKDGNKTGTTVTTRKRGGGGTRKSSGGGSGKSKRGGGGGKGTYSGFSIHKK